MFRVDTAELHPLCSLLAATFNFSDGSVDGFDGWWPKSSLTYR
jgi:hypothetical protein